MQRQTLETTICRVENGRWLDTSDRVVLEEPLEIRLNYVDGLARSEKAISITMRTPGNDAELAAGFLFTEGIIPCPTAVTGIAAAELASDPHNASDANTVTVRLADDIQLVWPSLERHFYATSSCGVCGKASLSALQVKGLKPILRDGFTFDTTLITLLSERLRAGQAIFDRTGGLHAAAIFDESGELVAIREDVGRHNAVDKLIGAEFLAGRPSLGNRLLFLSGRASFELVQKALVARIPMIASVGAPSSLAVELAKTFDLTLIGFVRDDRFNVYHGGWRLGGKP